MRTTFLIISLFFLCACASKRSSFSETVRTEMDSTGWTRVMTTNLSFGIDTSSSIVTTQDSRVIDFGDSGTIEVRLDGAVLMRGVKSVRGNHRASVMQSSVRQSAERRDSSIHQQAVVNRKIHRKTHEVQKEQPASVLQKRVLLFMMLGVVAALVYAWYEGKEDKGIL